MAWALTSLRPMRRLQCMASHRLLQTWPLGTTAVVFPGRHEGPKGLLKRCLGQPLSACGQPHPQEKDASLLTEAPTSLLVTFSSCILPWGKRTANFLPKASLLLTVTFCKGTACLTLSLSISLKGFFLLLCLPSPIAG